MKYRRVIGAEAIALGPKAAAEPGEAGDLPEIREELLDLALEVVEVALPPGHLPSPYPLCVTVKSAMARFARILFYVFGLVLYGWIAAVRNLPRVKARKRARARP